MDIPLLGFPNEEIFEPSKEYRGFAGSRYYCRNGDDTGVVVYGDDYGEFCIYECYIKNRFHIQETKYYVVHDLLHAIGCVQHILNRGKPA